jgi:activating signal cointegrator complex subunit 3
MCCKFFGRAGRPQFDTSGEGIIITSHEKLHHYLQMLVQSVAIESSFIKSLADHLNAEIVSGTVTNMREAVSWLSYTYLFIRMLRNPISYGVTWDEHKRDPMLELKRVELISQAAKRLDACHMSRFDEVSGNLAVTDLGRVASHYYISNESIETFNEIMDSMPALTDADLLSLVCKAHEFKNIKVREEELVELDSMKSSAHFPIKGDISSTTAKVNVLLQSYISQHSLHGFTLISDMAYINQSAGRISRALFEIFLRKGWCSLAERLLTLCKSIDKRQWWDACPLWQLSGTVLSAEEVQKLAESSLGLDALCELDASELGALVRHPRNGPRVANALRHIPYLHVEPSVQPITRAILRVSLKIYPDFTWNDRLHFTGEPFYVWIEDADNEHIYHHEYLTISRKQLSATEPLSITFAIPIFEPLPSQYWVRVLSDRWLGVDTAIPISFKHLILPERHPPHTDLLDLVPLPVSALKHPAYENMYPGFTHFNPVQTQFFHVAYHTDHNVLLGAPTGSGKTVLAELAIFRLWEAHVGAKAVYIAPLKALVSERLKDWRRKFSLLRRTVVELTGDFTPDVRALKDADVIITTPEKWDSISRGWQRRNYVKTVGAVIIDEIHLLGEDRGPVLEVIVSRMRYISSQTAQPIRFIGLSTALANARDLGDWLGIDKIGLYNFRPSVRPIPMEVHIQGFPGKHYCPRMATMNKPTYAAITSYSPNKPALVFVSSRRQTRLTALDLISLCAADEDPRRFLHMPEAELAPLLGTIQDSALRHTLEFGVGIHHAGLPESDRNTVEELYSHSKIQVLVCTSTLAWGVNFPAHLVVVKGTEYFDATTSRYVDYPITDVLQMMGRAGRPQFDTHAVAVILVHEPKKNFYRKFLYEPFPVESQLKSHLIGHLNAEIVGGTITCRKDALEYLTWTYFFRRLLQNPGYYGLEDTSNQGVKAFLFQLVNEAFDALHKNGCVLLGNAAVEALASNSLDPTFCAALPTEAEAVSPSSLGRIASFYYLNHATALFYSNGLREVSTFAELLELICNGPEFAELPVRHNEDQLNEGLSALLPWRPRTRDFASPHVKAFLLLQARFMHAPLPITDYITDTKSVLDQAVRVLHAAVDIAADNGLLLQCLRLAQLTQCVVMAIMPSQDPLWQLRGMNVQALLGVHAYQVPELMCMRDSELHALLASNSAPLRSSIIGHLRRIPDMSVLLDVISADSAVERSELTGQMTRVVVRAPIVQLAVTTEAVKVVQSAAVAPFYAKQKEWSWWVVIGDKVRQKLLAMKQVIGCGRIKNEFSLEVGKSAEVTVYLLSDTMRGIDQEYTIQFSCVECSL